VLDSLVFKLKVYVLLYVRKTSNSVNVGLEDLHSRMENSPIEQKYYVTAYMHRLHNTFNNRIMD